MSVPLHDPAPTLDASYGKGTGERAGIERQIIAESFIKTGFGKYEESNEKGATVCSQGGSDGSSTLTIQQASAMTGFAEYEDSLVAGSLRASGADMDGGEVLVTESPIGFSHTQGLDPQASTDVFPTLRAEGGGHAVAEGLVHCNHVAPTITSSGPPYSRPGNDYVESEALAVFNIDSEGGNSMKSDNPFSGVQRVDKAATLTTFKPSPEDYRGGNAIVQKDEAIPIHDKATRHRGGGDTRRDDGAGNGLGIGKKGDPSPTLTTSDNHSVFQSVVAPSLTTNDPSRSPQASEVTAQVTAVHAATHVVRRLTPIECERLQGFPDNYTRIPYKGKAAEDCPQGHRYRALGNSMAVPVMRWIGERIQMVDQLDLNDRQDSKTSRQTFLW